MPREENMGFLEPTFSLPFCGSWYPKGREHGVLRTPHALSCLIRVDTCQEENMELLEPHVLCPHFVIF